MVPESCGSFVDNVAVMLQPLASVYCFICPRFKEDFSSQRRGRCENQPATTVSRFRRPALSPSLTQNSSPLTTKPNSCPHSACPPNWSTTKYGLPESPQEDTGGPTKERETSSKFHSYLGKMVSRKDTSVYPENREMTRLMTAFKPFFC